MTYTIVVTPAAVTLTGLELTATRIGLSTPWEGIMNVS